MREKSELKTTYFSSGQEYIKYACATWGGGAQLKQRRKRRK
jgi:hypothetical protein